MMTLPDTCNIADGGHAQNGLSAEDVGFAAWHEMTHLGLDIKYGTDLRAILQTAATRQSQNLRRKSNSSV